MSAQTREEFRKSIFSGRKLKKETVKIRGIKVEVRQPTVKQILESRSAEKTEDQLVDMLVEYCYIPGTDLKVFDREDKGDILSWGMDSWFSDFNAAISKMTSIDVESAEKNLEEMT